MKAKVCFFLIGIFILGSFNALAREYHVSVNGSDDHDGSADRPFKTISSAGRVTRAGDTITVHEGIYRERINPPRGGTSDDKRIVYRAAAVEFTGEPAVHPVPSQGIKAVVSTTAEGSTPVAITDGDPKSKWQANKGEKSASVEIDLGKPTAIQSITLVEPWHPYSEIRQSHELQYLDGTKWNTIFTTETDGSGLVKNFIPVKAQKFRLLIKNEKEAPALNELFLFRAE